MNDEIMGPGFLIFFQVDPIGGGGDERPDREKQHRIYEDYLEKERHQQIMRDDDEIALLIRTLVTKGFL